MSRPAVDTSLAQPTSPPTVGATPATYPAAGLDRRFYAFVIDRLVAWSVDLLVALLAWRPLFEDGSVLLGVLLVLGTVLLVGGILSAVQGRFGLTPGKALLGLRVVRHGTGEPIGVVAGLLRGLVLGAGALPTFGLGAATLAWTAVMDPDRERRGWHDHVAGSIVVDVRPAPAPESEPAPAPRHIVNLTAMRLVPATPPPARAPAPPAPAPRVPLTPIPPAPDPTPEPTAARDAAAPVRWRVTFDTGETFEVEGLALVGRRPEPRADEPVRHLVPLRSEDMSLSKTHAQVQVAADGALVVTDRGSTNGSVLVRQGVRRELPPGRSTTLLEGDVVQLGDRRMTVAREG